MSLNLSEILHKVLNESVNTNDIIDVIVNHNYVDINYSDEDNNAPGRRLIQPYAYGTSKAGNPVLRAFQVDGDTLRGEPKWKTFRLDRIISWRPRKQTFNAPPPMQGYNVPDYNDLGDGSMSKVIMLAKFDNIDNDTLKREREITRYIKNAPKIASKNAQGPIPFASQQRKKNVYTSQPNSRKYAQWAKNIDNTANEFNRFDDDIWANAEAEKERQDSDMMQSGIRTPKQSKQGPVGTKNGLNDKENDFDEK